MWYLPNSSAGAMYCVGLVLIALSFMFGLFKLLTTLPDILRSQERRALLCGTIVLLLLPNIFNESMAILAVVDKFFFKATGQVQLFNSPFVFPKSATHTYNKSYCRTHFFVNNKPLNLTSRTALNMDRPICGLFLGQENGKYLGIPYKRLPDGTFAYWANLGTVYTSTSGPTDIVLE